jgi:hypothetical protein
MNREIQNRIYKIDEFYLSQESEKVITWLRNKELTISEKWV